MEPWDIRVIQDDAGNVLSIDMPRPSNFHAHLRADELMRAVAYPIMVWVKYLLVMPNTGPIDTVEKVVAYHRTLTNLAESYGLKVAFIMTLYLTDKLTPDVVEQLAGLPFKCEVKYYPPHRDATTGSGLGIPLSAAQETLRAMAEYGIPLLGHFESVEDAGGRVLPHAEREGYFMAHEFPGLRDANPDLRINIEHASTALAVERVREDPSEKTTCGFTPHHLLFTIEELMERSWRNHGRCMPILKSAEDVAACRAFATSGDPRAILGDDTAPHPSRTKEGPFEKAACGCWLPHSLALYALAFKMENALDERFVRFACFNGANWRGLPPPDPTDRVVLRRETERDIPDPTRVPGLNDVVIPLGWTTETDRLRIGLAFADPR